LSIIRNLETQDFQKIFLIVRYSGIQVLQVPYLYAGRSSGCVMNKTNASTPRSVVLLSGGLDSSTCVAIARDLGFDVYGISFRYGQRHAAEIAAAVSPKTGSRTRSVTKPPRSRIRLQYPVQAISSRGSLGDIGNQDMTVSSISESRRDRATIR
jgi:hypothetical protein